MTPNPRGAAPEAVDAVLPQTQCRQCGFEGCAFYAKAIAEGRAPVNRCAPGGREGILRICAVTGDEPLALDPDYGREVPFALARVRARDCIGCGWCVRACPFDAIAGAPKHLYGVIGPRCTGCALCAPACPVDAIDFVETGAPWTLEDARRAKGFFEETRSRRENRKIREEARLEAKRLEIEHSAGGKDFLAAILAKAQNKARRRS